MEGDDNPHMMTRTIALELIEGEFASYHPLASTPNTMEIRSTSKVKANDTLPDIAKEYQKIENVRVFLLK